MRTNTKAQNTTVLSIQNARCAYRDRNNPDNFNNNIGFRVVLSHNFCSTGTARYRSPLSGEQMAAEVKELVQSIPG